ncbi:SCO family protein [Asticcacaulis endophyticus]|uniref:Photosynthetic protein synthase I n=1 Tax=Asticcacaulis endophyticus TaxID=1395890 RepID=A0A918PW37_9CAUL|nr:SCO family protein [Asticcacaulis endophyticus]GGZ23003.1 photosynthetic protein synthase I [Asticcacaulis endophyticus]
MTKSRLTIILIIFVGLFALIGSYWYTTLKASPGGGSSQVDPSVKVGGDFTMTDQNGRVVTQDILKGKWSAVFFGFTYCPDICPLTLQHLNAVQKELGDKAKDFQIVFVTVDPERDSPAAMKSYIESPGFPGGVIGLTGTAQQVDDIAKAYRATYSKSGEGEDYTMNHTAVIYLMNPEGQFVLPLGREISPKDSADMIRKEMR